MNERPLRATSRPLRETDTRKRDLAWEILRGSNEPVVGFAKLMVPTALSAIGVIVGLAQAGGRLATPGAPRALVLVGCLLILGAMLLFAGVVYARHVRVSPDDYEAVLEELMRAASARHWLTTTALGLLTAGIIVAVLGFVV
jgi:hypothetical protein